MALVNNSVLLLADEPAGNVDTNVATSFDFCDTGDELPLRARADGWGHGLWSC